MAAGRVEPQREERMRTTGLGRCPACGEPIPGRNKLVEYRGDDGWTAVLAGCDRCDDVVHPR